MIFKVLPQIILWFYDGIQPLFSYLMQNTCLWGCELATACQDSQNLPIHLLKRSSASLPSPLWKFILFWPMSFLSTLNIYKTSPVIVFSLIFRQGFLVTQTLFLFFFSPIRKRVVVKEEYLWISVIKFYLHLAAVEWILKNPNKLSGVFENNMKNLLPFYSTVFGHALL